MSDTAWLLERHGPIREFEVHKRTAQYVWESIGKNWKGNPNLMRHDPERVFASHLDALDAKVANIERQVEASRAQLARDEQRLENARRARSEASR